MYEEWRYSRYPPLSAVLEQFPSVLVAPSLLLSQLPLLQPRFYSISSSPLAHPGEVHLTLAVVQFKAGRDGTGPLRSGFCSSWLNSRQPGDLIPVFHRVAQNFHLPENKVLPVIMVGSGTGIAPLRGFWYQRSAEMQGLPPPKSNSKVTGSLWRL